MKIKFENFTFDDNVIKVIEDKCFKVGAHDFNKYLHESKFSGKPLIDVIHELKLQKKYIKKIPNEKNLHLPIEKQKDIVIKFYKSLNAELGKRVENIFNNTDLRYSINITQDLSKDCGGGVSTRDGSNLIHLDANLDSGIHGLRVLAHEISHALSSLKTKAYDIMNNGSKKDLEDFFHHLGNFSVDSIGEIESHIVEFLFMDYLTNQKLISKEDYQNFEDRRNNSTLNNIKTIIEESYIFDNIQPPITPVKFEKFEKKIGGIIKTKKYKKLMNRVINMYTRDEHSGYSQYDFRYVIGEVVSSNWFEKYTISTPQQKQEMVNEFIKYLDHTHTMNLESSCADLLGLSPGKTFSSYISNIQPKSI